MNNLQDQRDWAPPQYNQYQQWAEIHPADPNVLNILFATTSRQEGSYSWRNQLGLRRGATTIRVAHPSTWQRFVPAPCSKGDTNEVLQTIHQRGEAKAFLAGELPVKEKKKKFGQK